MRVPGTEPEQPWPGGPALVLNMANCECLGGGFAAGIDGQEEELRRRTTLFRELAAMCPSPYPMGPHGVVLSPDVVVFRGLEPRFSPLAKPYHVAVATAAAPRRPDVSTDEDMMAYWPTGLLPTSRTTRTT